MAGGTRVPLETIERAILRVRGYSVVLDEDIAALYRVAASTRLRRLPSKAWRCCQASCEVGVPCT
jgi:hypothetical protein